MQNVKATIHRATDYSSLLQDARWQRMRKLILERDGHTCRSCGARENLHVHHKQYRIYSRNNAFVAPWEYPQSKLVTLCKSCHETGHKNYKVPVLTIDHI